MQDRYLLVAEKGIGYFSKEQIDEHKLSIFECGGCSKDNIIVFHNVLGRHNHINEERLNTIITDLDKLGYEWK